MALKETTDGTVLIHCYAGCNALAIVQAVGLNLADLFPNRLKPITPEERRVARRATLHADWNAALGVLCREATVVQCAAAYPQRDEALTDDDHLRLDVAVKRIVAAREVLSGR